MKLKHPTSNIQHPTPNGGGVADALDVRRSTFDVRRSQNGSVLIIVLWVAIGLVSIALYFANSMAYELRASDNRVSGLMADQAIEGAARYVGYVLQTFATNGSVPDTTQFSCAAVPVDDAKFWLIGRDLTGQAATGQNSTGPVFGLVDEGSKLNLNTVNTNVLSYLPDMTMDFAEAILDWRGTNGSGSLDYATLGYLPKYAPLETVDELRLVYGATVDMLAGDDLNRNGVLDANEKDSTGTGELKSGLFEYATVYTREPNFHSDGTTLTNVNTATEAELRSYFQDAGIGSATTIATTIFRYVHNAPGQVRNFNGILDLALQCRNAGMSTADFAKIYDNVTTSTNAYFRGRVNVNTASAEVLTALFEGLNNGDEQTASGAAQTLVTYRGQNPGNLGSIGWLIDALGNNSPVITALARGNYVTTKSFQFTADIAAVGPFGRGYRRVKFIFDISDGTPKILYRQDLSRLGWALGEKTRETLVAKETQ
jgi:type II secretory pathway component PulK